MRRATGFGRPMANRKDAAVMVWWARRQLRQAPWTAPAGVFAVALIWGIPGRSGQAAFTLFAGVVWGYLFGVLTPRRLYESITVNAKVAHAPLTEARAGLPSATLISVLCGAAVLAAVAVVVVVT
jgi:hypothetical protein